MELDFQPRKRFRLWETIWKYINVIVDRHYHSRAVHPAGKDSADISLKSTSDPEIGLTEQGKSLAVNPALGAAGRSRELRR